MVFEKTIREVVDDNYVYARALHYLGIDFFEVSDRKLKDVCREHGLDRPQLLKSFYSFDSCHRFSFKELEVCPVGLLIEYLKHVHYLFIKDKLPYIVHLAKKWDENKELQTLLPDFVGELIRHIYDEEDSTFYYVQLLDAINKGREKAPFSKLMAFSDFSLVHEFEHHKEEDELEAVRSLIPTIKGDSLFGNVLIREINAFDREMIYHAEIENSIFFPKAIALEQEVNQKIKMLSTLN